MNGIEFVLSCWRNSIGECLFWRSGCAYVLWFQNRSNSYKMMVSQTKIVQYFYIVCFIYLLMFTPPSSMVRTRKCWKRKYTVEVAMEGTFSMACRRNVTLHKCEGFCRSEAGPVVVDDQVRWEMKCNCCQPKNYKWKTVRFPACGASRRIRDISNCKCMPCWGGITKKVRKCSHLNA